MLNARVMMLLGLFAPAASLMIAAGAPTSHKDKKSVPASSASAKTVGDSFSREILPMVKQYCGGCHGVKEGSAGISLLAYHSTADVLKSRSEWERVAENTSNGHMPPMGMPQPTKAQREKMAAWIESTLSNAACDVKDPGHITMRRLNRDEYNNTVRDLTGMDLHPADAFPNDDVGYGFDNIGDVLSMSPILLEKYLGAAEKISEAVIITPEMLRRPVNIAASTMTNKGAVGTAREGGKRLDDTGSEVFLDHNFLVGGTFGITVNAGEQAAGADHCRMTLKIDDKPVRATIVAANRSKPFDYDFSVKVTAGSHRIALVYENGFKIPADPDKKTKEKVRWLIVNSLKIITPDGADVAPPESNRRIITVSPATPAENDACARKVLSAFARRAYRRPTTAAEVDRLVRYAHQETAAGASWTRGIQLGIQAILVSPNFLFRVESDPPQTLVHTASNKSGTAMPHAVNDYEMASRLSYFLWSSMPDETLFQMAAQGTLHKPETLAAQVKRMLRDPKAHSLADNFAGQWLQLRKLDNVSPNTAQFTDFNDSLRKAMKTETQLFFEAIAKEDRSVLDFLDAKYTFLNEPLAKHYGITGVTGENFRRVELTDNRRGGLITQASVLTVTSNPTRTSPVKRGKWVLDNLFNTPPPPAPPNVPQLADDKQAPLVGTLRQRMEQHRKDPACASCHARMDPIGFGLENYDAVGGWRTKDGEYPVDSSGILYGQKFSQPGELKTILLSKKKQFVRCLTEKMLTYGLGRGVVPNDRCNIDAMVSRIIQNDYKFSALVTTVVQSVPFRTRRGEGEMK